MGEGGFEPPKRDATDLQSAPFGHSGTLPYEVEAGGRTRTPDLLITNQLLYQLSYTSVLLFVLPAVSLFIIAQEVINVKRFFRFFQILEYITSIINILFQFCSKKSEYRTVSDLSLDHNI